MSKKNSKFEFKINATPHLKMSEITKRLFNLNFHADVQFSIEGKIVYAHTLELIKRSVVFEAELEDTMGEIKLIPVNDCKYENFLEFIRYVYIDECTINEDNFSDILKLATKYKFVKLENQVINSVSLSTTWELKCFEHCVVHKYEMARNFLNSYVAWHFNSYLKHKQFLTLHPDAVEELLKFERVWKNVTELQIFTGLAEWIISNCKMHQITLAEGRQRWDKLIRRIRFPTMSIEELRECYTKYPGLLSDSDRNSIAGQAIFGGSYNENGLWISKRRAEFILPYDYWKFHDVTEHETIFSVSKDTILHGIRIGRELNRKPVEIEISETHDKTSRASQKLIFIQNVSSSHYDVIIGLGESLRLKPTCKYTTKFKYSESDRGALCRSEKTDVIINDPGKTVNLIKSSANMFEMFFKPVTD